jgi:hypothetical protein
LRVWDYSPAAQFVPPSVAARQKICDPVGLLFEILFTLAVGEGGYKSDDCNLKEVF